MKFSSFLFLFLLTSISLFSQEEQKIVYGLKAGVNISDNGIDKTDYSLGFHIGSFGKMKISENFYVIPEILFHSLKTSPTFQLTDDTGIATGMIKQLVKENHLFFNVLIKEYLTKKFNVALGPNLDYFISRKHQTDSDYAYIFPDGTYNKFFLGINGGIGYDIKPNIELELHYNASFNSSDIVYNSLHKSVIMLTINYTFN